MVKNKLGIALSGGGIRGAVHLGILKGLFENEIYPDMIAGTSAGSIAGALAALEINFDDFVNRLMSVKPWRMLDPAFWMAYIGVFIYFLCTKRPTVLSKGAEGLFKGERIEKYFDELFQGKGFKELKIPLFIISTDVETGEEVVFCSKESVKNKDKKGRQYLFDKKISEAIRASISLPAIFVPKRIDGRKLVDGGIINNVPVDILFDMGAKKVIAVDLSVKKGKNRAETLTEIIFSCIDIMSDELIKMKEQNYPAFYISPDISGIGYTDYYRIPELVKIGEKIAKENISKIKSYLIK
ncbi:patatin-like phospholipase family protein [Thermovenabulum sp.]|uniref:patatin-like phospholipase family protein n=1 Tax=Thermovenabulum sp. TaxID=3100335 RepID=UPI003C7E3EB6